MWSDNETAEDLLGFKVHADLIIDVIKDDTILPVTIGVFGDWGSGKSSVLQLVKNDLEKLDDGTFVLYFNGWVFEGYDDAKAALLESIIKAFDDNKKLSSKVKDKTAKLLKSVKWMRLLGLGFKNVALPAAAAYFTGGTTLLPYLSGQLSKLTDNPEELVAKLKDDQTGEFLKSLVKEKEEDNDSMLVREFREEFAEMIEKSEIKKLVVIIDDLDRCTPDRIIENLEAIKLFLNVEKTAFLIGADPRIVRHAIEHRYKTRENNDNSRIVDDYLEKLIQIPYFLPKLSDSEVETYISLLICKRDLPSNSFNCVLEAFHKFRIDDRYSIFGVANTKEILPAGEHLKLTQNLSSIATLVPLITSSLYGNPRQIKRFLNTFILRKKLANVAKVQHFQDAVLAKLMILEYSELSLFSQLYEWQQQNEGMPPQIKALEDKCKDKNWEQVQTEIDAEFKPWTKEKVYKWLTIEPLLQSIDLRDYFWISRDKIASSIPGTSLIPPIVRILFQKLEEETPAGVTKSILQKEVQALPERERNLLLNLIGKALIKTPKRKRLHDLFHAMIDEDIPDASKYYIESLQKINVNDIEPAVGVAMKRFKDHKTIGSFIKQYMNNSSPAGKAFKI